jgi:hypothetical protein
VKPETAAFLDKARECLAKADGMSVLLKKAPVEVDSQPALYGGPERAVYTIGVAGCGCLEISGRVSKEFRVKGQAECYA